MWSIKIDFSLYIFTKISGLRYINPYDAKPLFSCIFILSLTTTRQNMGLDSRTITWADSSLQKVYNEAITPTTQYDIILRTRETNNDIC